MLGKTSIIVYSLTGTTAKVANFIKEATGGDLFNITCESDYSGFTGLIKGCYHEYFDSIPDIKEIPNIDQYDLIYIGCPVWLKKPATPIRKILQSVDFQNKKVIPFMTSARNYGACFEEFKKEAKNANIIAQGMFHGAEKLDDAELKMQVDNWLSSLNQ